MQGGGIDYLEEKNFELLFGAIWLLAPMARNDKRALKRNCAQSGVQVPRTEG